MDKLLLIIVLVFSIVSSVTWILRKKILNNIPFVQFVVIETFFVTLGVVLVATYLLKRDILYVYKHITYEESIYMMFVGALITCSLFSIRYLMKHQDISSLYPILSGSKMLMIFLAGIVFLNEKITIQKAIGTGSVLLGLSLLVNEK